MSSPYPPLPTLAGVEPELIALDAFKLAVADQVSKILEVPLEKAYEGVESGKTGKGVAGDFCVAVPRFRLAGKPNEIGEKLAAGVSGLLFDEEEVGRGRELTSC